ncbi:MAG TPA: hypothetical protein VLF43_00840 [Candidatus Saccharimonadales bacterium]|nr:hypothetical protein [Candidatus Saccharimonadales bacterium]
MRNTLSLAGQEQPETLALPKPDDLLLSVAEQLKVPLTIIARQAELGVLTDSPGQAGSETIRMQAVAALTLVDSYLLGLELLRSQTELELEPVSVPSLLVDTAHDLDRFARHYNVHIELTTAGKYGPVMSHARGLKAALLSLGFVLVEAQAAGDQRKPRRLQLATHRTPHGIVTGMYGDYEALSTKHWRTALAMAGKARQPLVSMNSGSGAGLFVADAILRSMQSSLRVGKYQHLPGLAATLQPSKQLQFV